MNFHDLISSCTLALGTDVNLKKIPTTLIENEDAKKHIQQQATEALAQNHHDLSAAQELLYASDSHSVLLIFQAMDAAGKDGTIAHVMTGVNPQGCQVFSFKRPSAEELDHNFLWRTMKSLPERGRIGIFNRSYYEDVLVVKVHPELINQAQCGKLSKRFWKKRYQDINAFEKHLTRNGTLVLKFFLHISKNEQKQRFLSRLNDPEKHWKFDLNDMAEREHWKDYQHAYQDAITATNTKQAPWHIIPADDKTVARALVGSIITNAIQGLQLEYPKVAPADLEKLMAAKAKLEKKTPPDPAVTVA
jgi:PPK2 family polyphosphate:nucleotide phosphotransferase